MQLSNLLESVALGGLLRPVFEAQHVQGKLANFEQQLSFDRVVRPHATGRVHIIWSPKPAAISPSFSG